MTSDVGRAHAQDFERKSALFSMASAEILVVNMWEHQVGLFQGANMGLLKTVLEVNLGLFQAGKARHPSAHKDKTLLLFVIRDHVGATPLQNLANTLKQDLNRIWDGLAKVRHVFPSSCVQMTWGCADEYYTFWLPAGRSRAIPNWRLLRHGLYNFAAQAAAAGAVRGGDPATASAVR